MRIEYRRTFLKDINRLRNKSIESKLEAIILELRSLENFRDYSGDLVAMKNSPGYYRIRIRDYRLGFLDRDIYIELLHIQHRNEIYKVFP